MILKIMQLAGQSAKKALQALRSSHLRNNLTSFTLNLQIFWHQKSNPQFPVHYIYTGIYFTFLQEIVKKEITYKNIIHYKKKIIP